MCTCVANRNDNFYFGRNMDIAFDIYQQVVITPRNHALQFTEERVYEANYAMIGMATVVSDYPLYAEAANERGLCMAGLNFPKNAVYHEEQEQTYNVPSYAFIPWILKQCSTVAEARALIEHTTITNKNFSEDIPHSPLHWMLADKHETIVVESVAEGLMIYDNPFDVLTNNPVFPFHAMHMTNYMHLSNKQAVNNFSKQFELVPSGEGFGAIGMPGDVSPASRFVRAAFLNTNSVALATDTSAFTQLFHILEKVSMTRGEVLAANGAWDITTYACVIDTQEMIYYYKTYENNQLTGIKMLNQDLDGTELVAYDLLKEQQVQYM